MTTCLMVGATMLHLAAPVFTLSWVHSVEGTEWRESWAVTRDSLVLTEARVKGSGAGMDPGERAKLSKGWWVWSPDVSVPALALAASGATSNGWRLCAEGGCRTLGALSGQVIRLAPCEAP